MEDSSWCSMEKRLQGRHTGVKRHQYAFLSKIDQNLKLSFSTYELYI